MFEEIAPKRRGAFRDVFLIIVSGFVLLSLPSWFSSLFQIPYLKAAYELVVLVGIGLFIYCFLRTHATDYRYVLVDDVLTIYGKSGARESVLIRVKLTEGTTLTKLSESKVCLEENGLKARNIAYGVSQKSKAFLLLFPLQNGNQGLIFQPSEQFVEILQQLLLDKREKI